MTLNELARWQYEVDRRKQLEAALDEARREIERLTAIRCISCGQKMMLARSFESVPSPEEQRQARRRR